MTVKAPAVMLIAALCATLAAMPASAKSISKIIRQIGLTPDDFTIMGDTAQALYDTASPRIGQVVSWTNPDSTSHGTVKLRAMRGNCAHLQHLVYPQGDTRPKEIRLRVCRDAGGNWLLQP